MTWAMLVREAFASARGAKVASILIAGTTAIMTAAVILLAGGLIAQRQDLASQLGNERTQMVQVDSENPMTINRNVVAILENSSQIDAVLGLSSPRDSRNPGRGNGSAPLPLWEVEGNLGDSVTLVSGRWPRPGEAVIARKMQANYGLEGPVGAAATADGLNVPIVGTFEAREAYSDLNSGILAVPTEGQNAPLRSLRVLAPSLADVPAATRYVTSLVTGDRPNDAATVTSSLSKAQTILELDSSLARSARSTLFIAALTGLVTVAGVVLADALIRARDIGRRRTLGMTRLDVILLVALRTLAASLPGVVLGALVGAFGAGGGLALSALAAIAIMTLCVAVLASVPPAIFAVYRDPVRVLRTP